VTESDAIELGASPATVDSLVADLASLGVAGGSVLVVHSSLRSLGWVCGGAAAVVLALELAVGVRGTLVMPTHSGDLSDPARWQNPPVPAGWWPTIRRTMPPYDPDLTPTRGMGAIPECFRKQAGTVRSAHPQCSFAARGPAAAEIVTGHSLEESLGERSPLARIYDLDGSVLLLGVGHESNTSLHLAEYRSGVADRVTSAAPILVEGERRWITFPDVDLDSSDFAAIGASFAREIGSERRGKVAAAGALLASQQALVDYAVTWMRTHRTRRGSGAEEG
jgi:aminoglycoside 3-N-acetyltransferase